MVKSKLAPGTTQAEGLDRRHRLNIRMGEPGVFARNLRLLTVMRGLTAEEACKGIAEMLRLEADAERDQVWERTKDADARQAASKKAQQIRKLNLDPKWYRRLTAKGVSRSDKRTRTQFHAIARFFGVRYESLWEPDLITFKLSDLHTPIVPPTNRFAIPAQKLVELLDQGGGRYDYLITLLDSLHAEAFPQGHAGRNEAGAWTMPDKD
jgi:hypothetical protein